jgi:hypothetical protein
VNDEFFIMIGLIQRQVDKYPLGTFSNDKEHIFESIALCAASSYGQKLLRYKIQSLIFITKWISFFTLLCLEARW